MNALDQYIELYTGNAATVDSNSSGVLNDARPQALEQLKELGRLPEKGDEGYEKISVNDMFSPDYGVNIARVNIPVDLADVFHCGVTTASTWLGAVANDKFVPTQSLMRNLPEGVTVMSLAKAAEEKPELVGKYYNRVASAGRGGATLALNTLFAQDGVFIHVSRGVKASKAMQIVNLLASPVPMMVVRRVLVVAEEDSEISILLCDHSRGEAGCLVSQVIEVYAGRGSRVNICDMEESSEATSRMSQLFAEQHEGAELKVCGMTLLNGTTRNEFYIGHKGDRAVTRLDGMAIGNGNQHIDNFSALEHCCDHGHSNQLFKYVLDGHASGAFEGCITVDDGARFNEAYQSNRNILASCDARMHAKPQLLIYNDDVKCSHGATTGQLDQNALFYMRQRGIPLTEARTMLMQAFMMDVIENVGIEGLSERLRHLVEKRFRGEDMMCAECSARHGV